MEAEYSGTKKAGATIWSKHANLPGENTQIGKEMQKWTSAESISKSE